MAAPLMNQRDLEFMLYELFDAEALTTRERYADHKRKSFDAAISTSKAVAEKYFLPYRQKVDTHQPTFDGQKVQTTPDIETWAKLLLAVDDTACQMKDEWFQAGAIEFYRRVRDCEIHLRLNG